MGRRLIFLFLGGFIAFQSLETRATPCLEIFGKIRKTLTLEETKIVKEDAKKLGLWRFFYKFNYRDAVSSAANLRSKPTSIFDPSPSIKEQAKDVAALAARALPTNTKHKLPLSIQDKMKTPVGDSASGVFKNFISVISGRPIYQAYPRYFSKVATGKFMDLNPDKLNYQRILKKMPDEMFNRAHMPVTGIEGRFWYNTAIAAVKASPIVWINSVIQNEITTEQLKSELYANKEKFLYLLTNDYRFSDILEDIRKRKSFRVWYKNISFDDLKKIYERHLALEEFMDWIKGIPKFEEVDAQIALGLKHLSTPRFQSLSPKQLPLAISIEAQKMKAQTLALGISPERFEAWRNSKTQLEQEIKSHFKNKNGPLWEKFKNNESLDEDELQELGEESPEDVSFIYNAITERVRLSSQLMLGKDPIGENSFSEDEIELTEEELGLAQLVNTRDFDNQFLGASPTSENLARSRWYLTKYMEQLAEIEQQIVRADLNEKDAAIYRANKNKELQK